MQLAVGFSCSKVLNYMSILIERFQDTESVLHPLCARSIFVTGPLWIVSLPFNLLRVIRLRGAF